MALAALGLAGATRVFSSVAVRPCVSQWHSPLSSKIQIVAKAVMTSPRHANLQQQSIQSAITFHRQGQLKEAERLYNDVLRRERNQFDALHLLGLLRYQQARYSDAQLLIGAALKTNSASVAALTQLRACTGQAGPSRGSARERCRARAPAPCHSNRGNASLALGRHEHALESYDRALAARPDDVGALSNRG